MTGPIETEVKIRIPEGAGAAQRLIEAHGYRTRTARRLQVDELFDFPDATLRRSGKLLRVRSAGGRAILTYKGPAEAGGRHKSREELETSAGDRAAIELILTRLGFIRGFRYEKYRTTFAAPDEPGLVELDETPIGVFLELEGPAYWIDHAAGRLGFAPEAYVLSSYASLYQQFLEQHDGPADMVFLGEE